MILRKILTLLAFVGCCIGGAAHAEVSLIKETEMTDYALWYSESDSATIISPHGDCLTIVNDYIFAVWYAGPMADSRVHISRKKIGEDHWVDMTINDAKNKRADSHRTVNVGVCPIDGTIHVAFDHHGTTFRYLHSVKGAAFVPDSEWNPSLIKPEQSHLSGTELPQVTYPQFWNNDAGELMMAYRRYGATAGEVTLSSYDGNRWSVPKIMIDGYGTGGGNFYAYNQFYNYFGKNYFLGTLRSSAVSGRNVDIFYAEVDGDTATGDFFTTRDGRKVNTPIESLTNYKKLQVIDTQIDYNVNDRHLVVTSDGTHYIAHNGRVFMSKPGETTFNSIKGTGGTLLGVGNKVFSFVVSSGIDKVSLYNPETDNWDRVYTGASGRGINKYFTARVYKNKIIALALRNGDGGPQRPINCIEIDTGEPDPTNTTAPTYGNGGIPGTGEAWPIMRSSTTRIEAENYDQNDETTTYSDTTTGNTGGEYRTDDVDIGSTPDAGGGYNVGWTKPGEWLQYTVDVERTGLYDVTIRYSRENLETSGLKLSMNGSYVSDPIDAAGTGAWGTYTSLTTRVELQNGAQAMRLHFLDGSINVNWLEITPVATPVITMVDLDGMKPWDAGPTWSDGNPAHGQADYVVPTTGNLISPTVSASFPGYSLEVETGGKFQVRSYESQNETITVGNLIFSGGSSFTPGEFAELSAGSGSYQTNVLNGVINNTGCMRILSFDKVSENPYNRGIKILSEIKGSGIIRTWEGQGGQGGDAVIIDNEANTFSGIWQTGTGSTLVFANGGSVGAADIEVLDAGKLKILGSWNSDASLTIPDSADAQVDFGPYVWSVSNAVFGGVSLDDGDYDAAELNAMGSNPVFTGPGTLRVGAGDPLRPIAHWKLDEGAGTTAIDASGNGHDGTIENGVAWGSDATRASYASFDGVNDRIETDFMVDITSVNNDFTWAYWVNNQQMATNDIQKNGVIVGNRYPALGEDLHFMKQTPTKQEVRVDGTNQQLDYDDLPVGVWHHCAVVKSGSTLTYYRDGTEVASRTLTTYAPAELPFFIGGDPEGDKAAEHFNGFIDDVVLYDLALTSDEVVNVKNGIYGGSEPVEPPMLDFGMSSGTMVFNWSGNVFKVQMCTNLTDGTWFDVPGGETPPVTNSTASPSAYFRLIEQ